MKILVLGVGLVGKNVAGLLKEAGHFVIGTTTTPPKVIELEKLCDQVEILRSDEFERLEKLAAVVDAIVVTVGPSVQRARNPQEREAEYDRALRVTCENVAAVHERCIFVSSFSVYGDGGTGEEPINEESTLSDSAEPSVKYYQIAEQAILGAERGLVLRVPDIYGGEGDIDFTERLKLGHSLMGGNVPFGTDALLYRVHAMDVARAVVHGVDRELVGVFNVCDNQTLPPTNAEVFDRLADEAGMDRLNFLGQILLPDRKISGEKLLATGFEFEYTDYVYR